MRVGIGRPPPGMSTTDYVLGKMDSAVRDAIPRAADAVEAVVEEGPQAAMNRFNVRSKLYTWGQRRPRPRMVGPWSRPYRRTLPGDEVAVDDIVFEPLDQFGSRTPPRQASHRPSPRPTRHQAFAALIQETVMQCMVETVYRNGPRGGPCSCAGARGRDVLHQEGPVGERPRDAFSTSSGFAWSWMASKAVMRS